MMVCTESNYQGLCEKVRPEFWHPLLLLLHTTIETNYHVDQVKQALLYKKVFQHIFFQGSGCLINPMNNWLTGGVYQFSYETQVLVTIWSLQIFLRVVEVRILDRMLIV